jgi:hypothetical protein
MTFSSKKSRSAGNGVASSSVWKTIVLSESTMINWFYIWAIPQLFVLVLTFRFSPMPAFLETIDLRGSFSIVTRVWAFSPRVLSPLAGNCARSQSQRVSLSSVRDALRNALNWRRSRSKFPPGCTGSILMPLRGVTVSLPWLFHLQFRLWVNPSWIKLATIFSKLASAWPKWLEGDMWSEKTCDLKMPRWGIIFDWGWDKTWDCTEYSDLKRDLLTFWDSALYYAIGTQNRVWDNWT